MSGDRDTTEERDRWPAEPTPEDREQWRTEAVAREQTAAATAKEIERVAALLPLEEAAAKRYLLGYAAGLRHRGR